MDGFDTAYKDECYRGNVKGCPSKA